MAYVIKAEIRTPRASALKFTAQKTMYGGRNIGVGDTIFLIDSETTGGRGLVARGVVTSAEAIDKQPGIARQTPRVSIAVGRIASAKRSMDRQVIKTFKDWDDGRPETELNFKLYRQSTNKIVGVSAETAEFLGNFF